MLGELLKRRREGIFRTLSIGLSALFFAHIPLLLFLVYMGHHGFFSYDFFSDGVFGLKVFFFLTSFFVVITSVGIFGWVFPLVERWKKGRFVMGEFIGILAFNIFLVLLMVVTVSATKDTDWLRILYILVIGVFVACHLAFLLYAKPNDQFRTLVALIFIVTMMSLQLREQASAVLSNALKIYGAGGGVEVTLAPKFTGADSLSGKLILLSPEYVYIKLAGSNEISTIERAKLSVITTKHPVEAEK